MSTKRTERGWGGHFICGDRCRFRRNTLLEYGDIRIVVSTVGMMFLRDAGAPENIGHNRLYETMAFHAQESGPYLDADVTRQVHFDAPRSIPSPHREGNDNLANDMHDAVVAEIGARIEKGDAFPGRSAED